MAREDMIITLLAELYDRQKPQPTSKNVVLQWFLTASEWIGIADILSFPAPDPFQQETVTITEATTVSEQDPIGYVGVSDVGFCEVG